MAGRSIRAAGGVVWRRAGPRVEVALVHRPRYDDWSLPKGKPHEGETRLETAVREVREEIGATVAVQRRLGHHRYVADGLRKKVTYWAMRWRSGVFEANDEVDDVRWLPLRAARELASYDVDRTVLEDFDAVPVPDAVVVLVRHAKAGKRTEWTADDALRPLDANGTAQAARLASLLNCFAPEAVYAADRVRCVQTVEPLAVLLGLEVRVEAQLTDEAFVDFPAATEAALLAMAKPGTVSVVCSQGTAIPGLVERFGTGLRSAETRKGAWWVLTLTDGDVVSLDHYDAP